MFDENTDIPADMAENFLKNSENKNNLSEFLSRKMIDMHHNSKHLVATYKTTVLCSSPVETVDLHNEVSITSCQSEEADQRIIRHALHCILEQYKKVVVRTVDTDVLILLISYVGQFYEKCSNIWIYANIMNSSCQYYDIIAAVDALGSETCVALPFQYAFTGCDIVSSFFSKGKCKAWDLWQQSEIKDELTSLFVQLGNKPANVSSLHMDLLEKFVLQLYALSRVDSLTQGRLDKFKMATDNDLRKLPPGRDALTQHTKRACYQAGYIWREATGDFQLPDPGLWGWVREGNEHYAPLWETSPSSQVHFQQFISTCFCGAQKCKNCKCTKALLKCIGSCKCGRKCNNV